MTAYARTLRWPFALCLTLAATGCIMSRRITVERVPVPSESDSATVKSPVKAHLTDGSIVVYARGVTVARNHLIGHGRRYSPMLVSRGTLEGISLDSVIGMETFRDRYNHGRTFVYSTLATIGTVAAYIGVYAALGGSLDLGPDIGSTGSYFRQPIAATRMVKPDDERRSVAVSMEKKFYRSRTPIQ